MVSHNKVRRTGFCVSKPLIIGTYATRKKDPVPKNGHNLTHDWRCVLRSGYDTDEDMTHFIRQVDFKLHETFDQIGFKSSLSKTEAPFEIRCSGYAEFWLDITIHWQDEHEKSLPLKHLVKLSAAPEHHFFEEVNKKDAKTYVISEQYDEAIFQDPHESFIPALLQKGNPGCHKGHDLEGLFKNFESDEALYNQLCEAHSHVQSQIALLQNQFVEADQTYRRARQALRSGLKEFSSKFWWFEPILGYMDFKILEQFDGLSSHVGTKFQIFTKSPNFIQKSQNFHQKNSFYRKFCAF